MSRTVERGAGSGRELLETEESRGGQPASLSARADVGPGASSARPTGWQLLHSKLPAAAIKELATSVYGVAGLSDVNEGFLIQRLFASGFPWEWQIRKQQYLGFEDKTSQGGKDYRVYMAAVKGRLRILDKHGWRVFDGSGASDNRKLDAAYKGAATVAFKNACKLAGMTAELYLSGRAIDHIYSERLPKDKEMVPERVEELVERITETYGDPSAQEQGSEKGQKPGEARTKIDGTAAPAETPAPAQSNGDDDERQNLYVLARTLKKPATFVEVDNRVALHGLTAVRRELILAHARDCGSSACEHVAQLAGLK